MANFAAPEDDRVPGQFRPIPASVAIHRKVAADYRNDPRPAFRQMRLACRQVIGATRGRSVPPIGDRVNDDFIHARFPGRIGEGEEMPVMAMHSAIRDQAR